MSTKTLDRDAILAMQAGAEMDGLVAEHVMGYGSRVVTTASGHVIIDGAFPVAVRRYSTDITAGWEVVEKCAATPGRGWPKVEAAEPRGKSWKCSLGMFHATAPSPALAICKAALLCVLGTQDAYP